MPFAHLFPIGATRQRGYAAAFFDVASPRGIEAPTRCPPPPGGGSVEKIAIWLESSVAEVLKRQTAQPIIALCQMRRCRTGSWFERPSTGAQVQARFTDNASEDEDHGEIYERVTCTACGRTGKVLGAPHAHGAK
jgi:hypothetical protein